ncbi:NAD-dependent epimerase/dehydratase family protein [Pelagibacteraceae bacterium]|jgi:UDP-glucose 4-epimerase|nr:NAD-dependent epimerase/dehydratase family protein [Pelagibacteraceae bacterium]|tara:strand:+ start:6598 stop:7614 length:1017 start_codon:yes stop_codon:yes gene_type:complete
MSKNTLKILVTGAAGFLGSHLSEKLSDLGHKVVGVDNMLGGYEDNVPENIDFHKLDCCDLKKIQNIMKGIDVVYHCAATAHEGLSVFSPYEITKNNYLASVSIFSAAVQEKVKRIIFCSSMARYGSQQSPFNEKMTPMPVDPYAISKVAAEAVLKNLCELNNIEWVIAVPHNIIGPKQKYDDPFRNVVSIMINRMLQGKAPIIYGDGNQTRCFSYIDDCLSCLIPMLDQKNLNKEIINIGPDEEFVTINKIAEICSNITGVNLNPIYKKDRPKEVKHATCSADKARKFLDYKTKVNLQEGIEKTFNYIKKRGVKPFDYHIELEIDNDLTPSTWKNKEI